MAQPGTARVEAELTGRRGRSRTALPYSLGSRRSWPSWNGGGRSPSTIWAAAKLARRAAERAVTVARRQAGEVEAAVEALDAEDGAADAGGGAAD